MGSAWNRAAQGRLACKWLLRHVCALVSDRNEENNHSLHVGVIVVGGRSASATVMCCVSGVRVLEFNSLAVYEERSQLITPGKYWSMLKLCIAACGVRFGNPIRVCHGDIPQQVYGCLHHVANTWGPCGCMRCVGFSVFQATRESGHGGRLSGEQAQGLIRHDWVSVHGCIARQRFCGPARFDLPALPAAPVAIITFGIGRRVHSAAFRMCIL